MGLAALLCLLSVFTLHLNIFNFQRVNVGVSLGFCRVSAGFPKGFRRFPASFLGFPQGFLTVSAGFPPFCADFDGFCIGFCMVSAEFRSLQVSLGATLFGRFAEPQARKSWRKVIMVVAQRCAKSYIFVGTISGARKRWNFATVLRGTSTVAISVFCNLKNVW